MFYTVQRWNLKSQSDAETLFAILHAELRDDPATANVVLNQTEHGPVLFVMWRSARACIREQMSEGEPKASFTIKVPGQKPKPKEPKSPIYAEME